MRAVASSPPCFAARLPDVFGGKQHVDVTYEYTVAEQGDNLALGHHTILRGSLASPTERVSFFPYFGVFPPYFFPLIYKDILMKKIVPTG
jgi:hypothetical protein